MQTDAEVVRGCSEDPTVRRTAGGVGAQPQGYSITKKALDPRGEVPRPTCSWRGLLGSHLLEATLSLFGY